MAGYLGQLSEHSHDIDRQAAQLRAAQAQRQPVGHDKRAKYVTTSSDKTYHEIY